MAIYQIFNGPMQTTSAPTSVTTSTSLKTLIQLKPGTTQSIKILAWGISFDGSAAATPIKVELIETDVAATVTAFASADITKLDSDALNSGDPTTNIISVGASASGFTATAEGTITAVRNLDAPQLIAPTNQFYVQFPLGQEPVIQPSKFGRIRVLAGAAVNAFCWMKIQA